MHGAKAVPEGIGNRAKFCCGADQSEFREVQLNRSCGRTLADNDVEFVIFHGWVENFFDGFIQPMDLIDEKNIAVG